MEQTEQQPSERAQAYELIERVLLEHADELVAWVDEQATKVERRLLAENDLRDMLKRAHRRRIAAQYELQRLHTELLGAAVDAAWKAGLNPNLVEGVMAEHLTARGRRAAAEGQ